MTSAAGLIAPEGGHTVELGEGRGERGKGRGLWLKHGTHY